MLMATICGAVVVDVDGPIPGLGVVVAGPDGEVAVRCSEEVGFVTRGNVPSEDVHGCCGLVVEPAADTVTFVSLGVGLEEQLIEGAVVSDDAPAVVSLTVASQAAYVAVAGLGCLLGSAEATVVAVEGCDAVLGGDVAVHGFPFLQISCFRFCSPSVEDALAWLARGSSCCYYVFVYLNVCFCQWRLPLCMCMVVFPMMQSRGSYLQMHHV